MTIPTVLNVIGNYGYFIISGAPYAFLGYSAPDNFSSNSITTIPVLIGATQNLTTTPYATFTDGASALNYYAGTYCSSLLSNVNSQIGTANYTSYNFQIFDETAIVQAISTIPTAVSQLTNDTGFITSSALSGYALASSLATVATSGSYNDLSSKPSIPAAQVNSDWNSNSGISQILNKPTLPKSYNGTTLRSSSVEYTNSGTFSSGSLVFNMTSDGTSSGTALFPTGVDAVNITVNSSGSAVYSTGYVLSNSNKTITLSGMQISSVIGLLTLATVANGVAVNVWVKGY